MHLNLGIAYLKMQDCKSAAPPLEMAAKLEPSNVQALELLAVAETGQAPMPGEIEGDVSQAKGTVATASESCNGVADPLSRFAALPQVTRLKSRKPQQAGLRYPATTSVQTAFGQGPARWPLQFGYDLRSALRHRANSGYGLSSVLASTCPLRPSRRRAFLRLHSSIRAVFHGRKHSPCGKPQPCHNQSPRFRWVAGVT